MPGRRARPICILATYDRIPGKSRTTYPALTIRGALVCLPVRADGGVREVAERVVRVSHKLERPLGRLFKPTSGFCLQPLSIICK